MNPEIEELLAEADARAEAFYNEAHPEGILLPPFQERELENDAALLIRLAAALRALVDQNSSAQSQPVSTPKRPPETWRTMESAPRDGSAILGWCTTPPGMTPFHAVVSFYSHDPEDQNGWLTDYDGEEVGPTAWQPLPEPPAPDAGPMEAQRADGSGRLPEPISDLDQLVAALERIGAIHHRPSITDLDARTQMARHAELSLAKLKGGGR